MEGKFDTRQTLIMRAQQRSEPAWEEFSGIYRRYVYVVIRSMGVAHEDTEDLVQEIMLKVWKALPDFEMGEGKPKFRTWLRTVTRNVVISFLRTRKRQSTGMDELVKLKNDQYLASVRVSEVDEIAEKEWMNFISNLAFDRIKDHFTGNAIAVFQAGLDGESSQETAARLGIGVASVYPLRSRVKQRLLEEVKRLSSELDF